MATMTKPNGSAQAESTLTDRQVSKLVDSLGQLQIEREAIERRERELKDLLDSSGIAGEVQGKRYLAKVTRYERSSIAYGKVVEALRPTPKLQALIAENTKTSACTRVSIKPLKPVR